MFESKKRLKKNKAIFMMIVGMYTTIVGSIFARQEIRHFLLKILRIEGYSFKPEQSTIYVNELMPYANFLTIPFIILFWLLGLSIAWLFVEIYIEGKE